MTLTTYTDEHIKPGLNNVRITTQEAEKLFEFFPIVDGDLLVAIEDDKRFEMYECIGGWRLIRSAI